MLIIKHLSMELLLKLVTLSGVQPPSSITRSLVMTQLYSQISSPAPGQVPTAKPPARARLAHFLLCDSLCLGSLGFSGVLDFHFPKVLFASALVTSNWLKSWSQMPSLMPTSNSPGREEGDSNPAVYLEMALQVNQISAKEIWSLTWGLAVAYISGSMLRGRYACAWPESRRERESFQVGQPISTLCCRTKHVLWQQQEYKYSHSNLIRAFVWEKQFYGYVCVWYMLPCLKANTPQVSLHNEL